MYTQVTSGALMGISGYLVHVEVDVSDGFPRFDLVGLPDSAVKESIERVRTSIKNSSFQFPYKRITVNLAPADRRKEGPCYDLPIATGILCCENIIKNENLQRTMILGELSLNGEIRKVNGILPMIYSAFQNNFLRCIVPYENASEASIVEGIEIIGVKNLLEVVDYLNGSKTIEPIKTEHKNCLNKNRMFTKMLDFKDIKGQETVRRALEIAAAGMHNVITLYTNTKYKVLNNRQSNIYPNQQ